ncbi:MAG: amino acid permease [Bacteroidetes bacterium]|nr:amino acid permease [Bacteroidota bacterium]MBK8657499.1 amino acid permease [Bacteroidota bacterium]
MSQLIRGLSLRQAVAINTIDMVGIGPFITIPFIIGAMNGPQCILAWILGAILSFADGAVWAELGAKWPMAGGSYSFLQNLYGKHKTGRMLSFLYIWQTIIQAPLVVASGAIGFSQYLTFLVPLSTMEQKLVSGALVAFITVLLYRKITDIGKISVLMGMIVGGTILWLIVSAVPDFNSQLAFSYAPDAFDLTPVFFFGLGQASIKTVYSFLGYYNVCHLGAEIKDPEANIPRSIFISIAIIATLYLLMQIAVLGIIPWQEAKDSPFIVSLYFEKIYGHHTAMVATALVLFIAITSLFAVLLGYSRVPYAAAVDGNFFAIFGQLHPTKNFPHVSLLILAGIAFLFSLLFKMKEVITAIIVMRILVQFLGQSIGIMLYHRKHRAENFPYRMPLYPLPALVGIAVWLFIFFSAEWIYIAGAVGIILLGILMNWVKEKTANSIK